SWHALPAAVARNATQAVSLALAVAGSKGERARRAILRLTVARPASAGQFAASSLDAQRLAQQCWGCRECGAGTEGRLDGAPLSGYLAIYWRHRQADDAQRCRTTHRQLSSQRESSEQNLEFHDSLVIQRSPECGRYAVAKRPLVKGEILYKELPYCTVLLRHCWPYFCYHCLAPLALATKPQPQFECADLDLIESTGIGHLAYRILLTACSSLSPSGASQWLAGRARTSLLSR
uniref:Zf-C3HC4 domain-containing protein n=1 Tax=Macrostomum lignano TaxID=282301 RepID=A0A1I8FES5_9PLAT